MYGALFFVGGFSIGKGSLNLDALKGKGKDRATLHAALICMVMLGVAKTAVEIERFFKERGLLEKAPHRSREL